MDWGVGGHTETSPCSAIAPKALEAPAAVTKPLCKGPEVTGEELGCKVFEQFSLSPKKKEAHGHRKS